MKTKMNRNAQNRLRKMEEAHILILALAILHERGLNDVACLLSHALAEPEELVDLGHTKPADRHGHA